MGRLTLLCALVAALIGQSVLTQSHVHPVRYAAQAGFVRQAIAASAPHGPSPADCPICREIAQAGHYLTPASIVLPAIAVARFEVRLVPLPRAFRPVRWRGWHSRAPPLPARHR